MVGGRERFDVAAVRQDHPIEAVVAASCVGLTRRGQGFMGCCPFHDYSTASLSVGGVPDRFHCSGCGAGGDVIEYVTRFTGGSFVDAAQALGSRILCPCGQAGATVRGQRPTRASEPATTPGRAHAISRLAWECFTTPA